jgi:hypothetical protein
MKILSVDVGIKNLALCVLEKNESIHNVMNILKWNVVNISEEQSFFCCCLEESTKRCKKEKLIQEKDIKQCKNPVKYEKNGLHYCLKHSKKQDYQVATHELTESYIQNQKIDKLHEIIEKYKIEIINNGNKKIKKQDLVQSIHNYITKTCFQTLKIMNASKVDLISVGRNIKIQLDGLLKDETYDKIIIENQISPIANRMKTIQGMIAQYFIMKNTNQSIEFVSSQNKLNFLKTEKTEKTEKTKYKDRKNMGIKKTAEILANVTHYKEWLTIFKDCKKKDDMADCFLQGVWYMQK